MTTCAHGHDPAPALAGAPVTSAEIAADARACSPTTTAAPLASSAPTGLAPPTWLQRSVRATSFEALALVHPHVRRARRWPGQWPAGWQDQAAGETDAAAGHALGL